MVRIKQEHYNIASQVHVRHLPRQPHPNAALGTGFIAATQLQAPEPAPFRKYA